MKMLDSENQKYLNVEIDAGRQTWNAVYLDYQIEVLRDLAANDEIYGSGDPEDHPLAGIIAHLEAVLEKCGFTSNRRAAP